MALKIRAVRCPTLTGISLCTLPKAIKLLPLETATLRAQEETINQTFEQLVQMHYQCLKSHGLCLGNWVRIMWVTQILSKGSLNVTFSSDA